MTEEQQEELEVLRSIYDDRLVELEPSPPRLRITGITAPGVGLDLEVEFTTAYPQEAPIFAIITTVGKLPDTEALLRHVREEVERSLGMAMVFTLVSSIEEWLAANIKPAVTAAASFSVKPTKAVEKRAEPEDAPISLRGGPVTRESFAIWNAKFLAEVHQAKALKEKRALEVGPTKLTGRQLFEQNRALAESDVTFGDEVVVDLDLFEGLDDLEIDNENGGDGDYGGEDGDCDYGHEDGNGDRDGKGALYNEGSVSPPSNLVE